MTRMYDAETMAWLADPQIHADTYLSKYCHESRVYTLRYWRDEFYAWDGFRYVHVPTGEVETGIVDFLLDGNAGSVNCDHPTVRITRSLVANIMLCIKGRVRIPWQIEPNWLLDEYGAGDGVQTELMGFCNRVVDIERTGENAKPITLPNTPRFFNLTHLPYDYDEHAQCPRWEAFLDDVMEGDGQRARLLRQWAGYLLSRDLTQHKFMLLAGEGSNGKTTFTTALEDMLGPDSVSHVPISQFGDRFALASTIGKRLNSTSESTRRIDEFAETVLKSYTSGDRMTVDRKFREPIHTVPTAKVMISTNVLPEFSDRSSGLWRRMLFVPFEKTVAEHDQDKALGDRLLAERAGIFNWALRGYADLKDEGRFVVPQMCRKVLGDYRSQTNPARTFLTEHYTEAITGGVPCGELYDAYRTWCEANGYRPLNSGNFGKEVKRTFRKVVRRYSTTQGSRIWMYEGLSRAG